MQQTYLFDFIAVAWLLLCWSGYSAYSDRGAARGNLIGAMARHRERWMIEMLSRENRIVDIQIINLAADTHRKCRRVKQRYGANTRPARDQIGPEPLETAADRADNPHACYRYTPHAASIENEATSLPCPKQFAHATALEPA